MDNNKNNPSNTMGTDEGSTKANLIGMIILGLLVGLGLAWLIFGSNDATTTPEDGTQEETSTEGATTTEETPNGAATGTNETGETPTSSTVTPSTPTTVAPTGPTVNPSATSATVLTVDTQPASQQVAISRVELQERSWIVVHEDDRSRPGRILGARRLPAGVHTNVNIKLLRETQPAGVYYVMVHSTDANDTFEIQSDLPQTDAEGNLIMVRFTAEGKG